MYTGGCMLVKESCVNDGVSNRYKKRFMAGEGDNYFFFERIKCVYGKEIY